MRSLISVIEERGFFAAAQADVEAVAVLPFRPGYEPLLVLHNGENGVDRMIEKHHGLQLPHQPRIQDEEVDVGSASGRRAGPDGAEAVVALGVGRGASPAGKRRVIEAPSRVRLPDLQDYVVERLAVELGYAPGDLDHLTRCTLGKVIRSLRELARKKWAKGHLGGGNEAAHGICALALRPRTTSWCSKIISLVLEGTRRATHRSRAPGSRMALRMASASLSGSPGKNICVTRRESHTRPHTERCTCGGRHQPPVSGTG